MNVLVFIKRRGKKSWTRHDEVVHARDNVLALGVVDKYALLPGDRMFFPDADPKYRDCFLGADGTVKNGEGVVR